MRIYFLLIVTAIILSFSTAYFAINLQNKNIANTHEIEAINNLKLTFENTNTPIAEIDLSSLYPSRDSFQLIQPVALLSKGNNFSKPCSKNLEKMTKKFYEKDEIWEDFRCHKISKLPAKFFESAPLIHESGLSYTYMAYQSGNELYSNSDWARANLNYFHILELKELPNSSLDGLFKIIAQLEKPDLLEIISRKKSIITRDYYLGKKENDLDLFYKVYSKQSYENFFKAKNYFIRPIVVGEKCFYVENSFCYEKDSGYILQAFKKSTLFIFFFSMLVLFLVAVILFRKIKQQKFEEERKKHALRWKISLKTSQCDITVTRSVKAAKS